MRSFLVALAFTAVARAADFPAPFNTEPAKGAPLPPDEAAVAVKTPPGFHVSMFAAEPDVQQPIAIATDSRGRLWVAECYTYAESKTNFDTTLRDRVVIFEDADNDGHFDKRTVFWDQGQRLSSVELGFGGVWVTCAPNLLFIPDKNGDDIPDGPPEVVLDGWDAGNVRHNIVNGLRWGPDGWLYGRHGILATSLIGAPGTPSEQRTKINAGIWRYHPTRKVFEVVAHGTTNPWGMDWNEAGEGFFSNTVIGHLWHLIPGAHYERMYGEDFNPHVYQLLGQCADHYHFDTGAGWTKSRATFDGVPASASDALGGGHAHCGCLIYQGDQWPEYWRGKVLTINFHGRRLNVDRLERRGSSYVAKHEPDAFFFGDPWFRGIDLIQAPDGGVFVADWNDASECHDNDGVHRTSGRIYKITYDAPKRIVATSEGALLSVPLTKDVAAFNDLELVQAQFSKNEWFNRTARRVSQERVAKRPQSESVSVLFRKIVDPDFGLNDQERAAAALARDAITKGTESTRRLRLIWALEAMDASSQELLRKWTQDRDEMVRAWAVRILAAQGAQSYLLAVASSETSPLVRRAYAESLSRMRGEQRNQILGVLLGFADDRANPDLPLLLWHQALEAGIEPLRLTQLAAEGDSALFQRFTARLVAENMSHGPQPVSDLLDLANKPALLANVVAGMADGLRGLRKVAKPEGWDRFAANAHATLDSAGAARLREIEIIFGDGRALDEIRAVALDAKVDFAARRQAVQSLIDARVPDLRPVCEQLLEVRDLAGIAARGLATFDDPKVGALLLQRYGGMYAHQRPEAIGALVSRPAWATMLLDAIANGQIARTDLDAYHARQIRAFNNDALTKRLADVWGDIRETDEAKKALMTKLKAQLTPEVLAKADLSAGRALFNATCAACHKLHGEGGALAPDLTGSARDNLTYLLENIIDPNAIVPVDFRLSIVTLKDGRVLSGFVGGKTERTFTLRTMTDTPTIDRTDVEKIVESPNSLMPEGLLSALNEAQVRDLIGYLQSKAQVPLPK